MKLQPWFRVLLVGGLMIALILAIRECSSNERRNAEITLLYSNLDSVANVYRSTSDFWVAEAVRINAEYRDFKAIMDRKVARLEKELKVKPKSIKEYIEVFIEGKDSVILEPVFVAAEDTTFEKTYKYEDEWNIFEVWASEPNVGLSYYVSDSIDVVTHYDGGLFRRGQWQTSVISYNPAIQIRGLRSISIKQKEPVVTLGFQTGYGVTKGGFGPYAGIGAQVNLVRLFRQ